MHCEPNCQTGYSALFGFNGGGGGVVVVVCTITNYDSHFFGRGTTPLFSNPSNTQSAVHVCFESRVADVRLLLNISINTDGLLRLMKVLCFLVLRFFISSHLFASSSLNCTFYLQK